MSDLLCAVLHMNDGRCVNQRWEYSPSFQAFVSPHWPIFVAFLLLSLKDSSITAAEPTACWLRLFSKVETLLFSVKLYYFWFKKRRWCIILKVIPACIKKGLKAICCALSTQLELQTPLYLSASPPRQHSVIYLCYLDLISARILLTITVINSS